MFERPPALHFHFPIFTMNHIRAALFDLDGVIVDTEGGYTEFWDAQGRMYLPEIENFAAGIKGFTLAQVFERFFPDMPEARREITGRLDAFERGMPYGYIPGAPEFVSSLRSEGVRTAIVTSSNNRKMEAVFARCPELRGLFDAVVTSESVSKSKPDPECYLLGAKLLGAGSAWVFEDSISGLRAGAASGFPVIGLATTLPAEKIAPYCSLVIRDFRGASPAILERAKKTPHAPKKA